MDFVYEDLKDKRICLSATSQGVVTAEIDTTERGGISRILALSAEGKLFSVEKIDNQARLSGKINFKLLYLDEEGKPSGLDYFSDFEERIEDDKIGEFTSLWGEVDIIETESNADDGHVTLSAVCSFSVCGVGEKCFKPLVSSADTENAQGMINLCKITTMPDYNFTLEEEVESGVNIDKVLFFASRVISQKVSPIQGGFKVEGVAVSDVVFTADGKIEHKVIPSSFQEEVEGDGEKLLAKAVIRSSRLVLSGSEDNNLIKTELNCVIRGVVFSCEEKAVITDCFSTTEKVQLSHEVLTQRNFVESRNFREKISAEIPYGEEGTLVATLPDGVRIANLGCEDGRGFIEGVCSINLVFATEEGAKSVFAEIPFSLTLEGDFDGNNLEGEAIVVNISARGRGSVVDIKADLDIRIDEFSTNKQRYILSALASGEKLEEKAGISVYFASEKDTPWEIAKAMGVGMKELLQINPSLSEGVKEGQKIFIFRERK